jgi:hypothetical protein|tara:strand:+ start:286 stop:669 length:384 start_codon:yes stop_codon:yes gene_type:complete
VGRKNLILTYNMLNAIDLDTSANSSATFTTTIDQLSINIVWSGSTGTNTGAIVVQGTNKDPEAADFVAADYFDLELSGGAINLTGASGEHIVIFDKTPFRAIRLVYTNSTHAAGTVSAIMSAKTLGA